MRKTFIASLMLALLTLTALMPVVKAAIACFSFFRCLPHRARAMIGYEYLKNRKKDRPVTCKRCGSVIAKQKTNFSENK